RDAVVAAVASAFAGRRPLCGGHAATHFDRAWHNVTPAAEHIDSAEHSRERGTPMNFESRRYAVADLAEAMELCFTKGWTDGLPVIPPGIESVTAMLQGIGVEPDQQIAFIENRQVSVTAEKVAINAVMAGCKPEYMPVVVAAVEAMADPLYNYHGPATST